MSTFASLFTMSAITIAIVTVVWLGCKWLHNFIFGEKD